MVIPQEIGEVFGVITSLNSLTTILGPLVAGFLYDSIQPSAPYLIGSALLLIALVLLIKFKPVLASLIN